MPDEPYRTHGQRPGPQEQGAPIRMIVAVAVVLLIGSGIYMAQSLFAPESPVPAPPAPEITALLPGSPVTPPVPPQARPAEAPSLITPANDPVPVKGEQAVRPTTPKPKTQPAMAPPAVKPAPVAPEPAKTGRLARGVVRGVLSRAGTRLAACNSDGLQGAARVRFTVDPKGRVASATLNAPFIQNKGIRDCIIRVLQSLVFPPPEGGGPVTINYPFTLSR